MPVPHYRGVHFNGETLEKPKITKALLRRILSYFKPYWKLMLVMLAAIAATSVLGIVSPILTKNIIDVALPDRNIRLLVFYIGLSFGTLLVLNLITVGQSTLNTLISKRIIRDLRAEMFGHMQEMSLKFFSNVKSGEINSRLTNDIGGIESVFSGMLIQIVSGVLIFATTTAALFYTNWMLAVVSLLTLPLFVIPTRKVGKTRWKIAGETQAKLAELTTIITETLNVSGTMLIKLFTREKDKSGEFEKINEDVTRLGIRESIVGRWFFMTLQVFISLGPLLIYLFGGIILIRYNTMTVGGIVMFVALVARLYGPISTFANIHVDVVRSMALFERIFQYFDLESEIKEKPNAVAIREISGYIRFDGVSFSYGEKADALSDITFDVAPGQMAAFVGPSGAGKTTITYLVPRLYDVSGGAVLIDGTDIRDMTLHSLRRQIGMVTQDTYLFNASIRENLLFAKPDATEEALTGACRTANIHDFIVSLPDGYDTVVGEPRHQALRR